MLRSAVAGGCMVLGCMTLAVTLAGIGATPASAQIGTIFSDPPLRPPGAIPGGEYPPEAIEEEEEVPELPHQGRLMPMPAPAQPHRGQGVPRPGAVQSQPLPPPPGGATAARPAPGGATPPSEGAKGQAASAPPAPATLQPGDEIVTEPPSQRVVNKKAVFAGLDKITGRIISFDTDINETVQFGALRVKTDACYTRPATEAANTNAFVEVDEITLQGEVKRIFSGWMYAASPGLHGVEHPIYDVWLTDCKDPDATVVSNMPDPPKSAPAAAPAQKRVQRAPQPRPRQPAPLPPFQQ